MISRRTALIVFLRGLPTGACCCLLHQRLRHPHPQSGADRGHRRDRLNFAFGYAGLITLAQAGFVGCGAYITAILSTTLGLSPFLSIPTAVVGTGLIAIVIGLPMLRLKGHYLALATLGFNVSFVIVATNWKSVMGGTDGISGIPSIALPGWPIANDHRYYYVLWVALAVATWCAWRIRNSRIGLAMIAVRDDEIATGAASVGVTRIELQAFALPPSMPAWPARCSRT